MNMTQNYKTMSDTETNSGLTLVLIGFQGSGKSMTGNTILKRKSFRSGLGTRGSTNQVKIEECERVFHDSTIVVVDTPPLLSTESLTAINNDLSKQQLTTAVYAIVIAVGRFTEDEKNVVGGILSQSFMQDRTLLIFTRKNELNGFEFAEDKLEAWLETTPTIRRWIHKYNLKYFAIENTSEVVDHETNRILEAALHLIYQNQKHNCSEIICFRCCYLSCCYRRSSVSPGCVTNND